MTDTHAALAQAEAADGTAMQSFAKGAGARLLSFLPAALATLAASRLVIHHYSIHVFDSYVLIASTMILLPVNDLGAGAAITSAFATNGPRHEHSVRVALTCARTVVTSAIVVGLASAVITWRDLWPRLLGPASGSNTYFGIAIIIWGASFLPALGQPMLIGVNRNHVTILVQVFFTPLMFAMVLTGVLTGVGGPMMILIPPIALVAINGVTAVMSARITGFRWFPMLVHLPRIRRYPGARIRSISGPMLLTIISVPIALQSDRIVLSHVSTITAVAQYAISVQIFAPVLALIAAASQPLWPLFARARAGRGEAPNLFRVIALFGSVALAICAVLCLAAEPIAHLIGGSQTQLGWLLPISTALAIGTQAAAYPIALALTDPPGLRFVGFCSLLAMPVNVVLSIILAKHLGASGPLLATFGVGLLIQTLPAAAFYRWRNVTARHLYRPPSPVNRVVLAVTGLDGVPRPAFVASVNLLEAAEVVPKPRSHALRRQDRVR